MNRSSGQSDRPGEDAAETAQEALRRSPDFRGPVEPIDNHEPGNDHFALIYESCEDQLAVAIPFARQGLERGERVQYIADENSRDVVLEAMRDHGIDVDVALESGALSVHTKHDTYLRNGTFDPDGMIEFLQDTINDTSEKYEGLRVIGETTWALGDEPDIGDLIEYESLINDVFDDEDFIGLCQYNCNRFSPEVIRDIIHTHPHLISNNEVFQNIYYTPPEETFSPEYPTHQIDRMVGTLRKQAGRARAQQKLYRITADNELSFEEKVERLLDLGRDRFDLDMGFLLKKEEDTFRVMKTRGTGLAEGVTTLPSEPDQYCNKTISLDVPLGVEDVKDAGWDDDPRYQEYDLGCYLGTKVTQGSSIYGTIAFSDNSPRERDFTDEEYTFLDLMGQWLSYALEREQRETQLKNLNEISRDLMNAETWDDIAQKVISYAESAFDLPVTAIVQYDASGTLSPAAQTPNAEDKLPTEMLCESQDGAAWDAFITNEMNIVDGKGDSWSEIVLAPIGKQGVFITASTASSGFAESEVEFIETITATVEAAFARAGRERKLDEQNADLHRLSQINAIIRGIGQALVQAETQSEIDQSVCERFADSELFEFAWIGKHDVATDKVKPREWAGIEPDYFDDLTITTDDRPTGQGPIGAAVRTHEVQVVEDIILDSRFDPWRDQTLDRGVRSCVAIPLTYKDSLYGVLAVYANHQQNGKQDVALLEELGETIAYAINTIESRETHQTDSVVELTLQIPNPATTLATLAQRVGIRIDFEGLVPAEDGSSHVFFKVTSTSVDEIHTAATGLAGIEELDPITESEDGILFRATVSGPLLVPTLTAHGAAIRTLRFDGNNATVIVDLPSTIDVRSFLDTLRDTYSEVKLASRRSCSRALKSVRDIRMAIKEPLTDRQMEVLKMAYLSGFFESPRSSTGQEIADSLGISPPTFTQHLRAGQRKVFSLAFDEE